MGSGNASRFARLLRLPVAVLVASALLAGCQSTSGGPGASRSGAPAIASRVEAAPLADLGSAGQPSAQSAGLSYASATATAGPGQAEVRGHSAIVIDVSSGQVLHSEAADGLRYPASLTKMMTLYLLFDALDRGEVAMSTPIPVSAHAARQPPARIGLVAGETIPVSQAIQALAVKSANDVAVAVAEKLGGSEEAFAARMTAKARSLGMSRTRFVNASGLPDPRQVTSARDMAVLARALKTRHAGRTGVFTQRAFTYKGRTFEATNKLLGKVAGVDGLKTGYISLSGYNLAASAVRGGRRIIAVVMGGSSETARNREVETLVETYL